MPFPNIGAPELIVILIIALVVLGPGKLPDVASSLGRSLREFRKAASDVTDAGRVDAPPAATPTPAAPVTPAPAAPVTPAAHAEPNTIAGAADPNTLAPAGPASDPDHS
jgi:TatA/E family protein of Tat protein translocase